jgi:hypothetical protein
MSQDTFKWKVFSFSLMGRAEQWYSLSVRSMDGDWESLRKAFCLTFFPTPREVICFEQRKTESLGAAWAKFTKIVDSGPDLGIIERSLLQHFRNGLGPELAIFLDSSSEGSFTHLTLSESKDLLTKILQNTPYTGVYDEFPDEQEITQEEHMPNILSEPKPIEEKPTSTFWYSEPLLYPRVYQADFLYDFDEESTNSDPLSESEFIKEEPILEKFISTDTYPPFTNTWFTGEPFQPYRKFYHASCDLIYEYYDELF